MRNTNIGDDSTANPCSVKTFELDEANSAADYISESKVLPNWESGT